MDFNPPPVPEGEAPIIISVVSNSNDAREIFEILIVLKPTVVMDAIAWKNDATSRFSTASSWIVGSEMKRIMVPIRLTQNVQCRIILVVRVTCWILFVILRHTSTQTMKPTAPV